MDKIVLTFIKKGCAVIERTYDEDCVYSMLKDIKVFLSHGYHLKGHMIDPPNRLDKVHKKCFDPAAVATKSYKAEVQEDQYQATRAKLNIGNKYKRRS